MNSKSQFTFYLILVLGAIFILTAFYYEGRATERFGASYDAHLRSFKDAVENAVPNQVGVWFSDKSEDQIGIENELIRRVAGADGSLGRHYRGSFDHPDVHINITCGYSRNVGAHTPDVCFTGSGSVQETPVETYKVDYKVELPDPGDATKTVTEERTATFRTAIFSDADGHYKQRVFWGWKGVETGWVAPRFPRLKWNPNEPICKMYVSLLEDSGYTDSKVDTLKIADEFLQLLLPELDKILTGKYVLPEGMRVLKEDSEKKSEAQAVGTPKPDAPEKTDEFDLGAIPSVPAEPAEEAVTKPEKKVDSESEKEKTDEAGKSEDEDPFAL